MTLDGFFVNVRCGDAAGDDGADGVDKLRAAAVVERKVQAEAGVGGGEIDDVGKFGLNGRGQAVDAADGAEPDVVLAQRGQL